MKNKKTEMLMMVKPLKKNMINLPTPKSITYLWNMGSMLGCFMMIQISTGIILSTHYIPHPSLAFDSYILTMKNSWMGFMMKYTHSTTVSLIFIMILIHIFRSLLYSSYKNSMMWNSGMILLIMLMMSAFMGYMLPWGQMSLWGATVICNMFSAIPKIGEKMVQSLWGDYSVDSPTLNRFFTLHFMIPILMMAMMMIHLTILHKKGSSNTMNINSKKDSVSFMKKFYYKDLNSIILTLMILTLIISTNPTVLIDPENFIPANPMITPIHIMPEWYFLFAYCMLRSIPNKMGGILIMIASITIMFLFPLMKMTNSSKFDPLKKMNNSSKMSTFMMLTFMGSKTVEKPFDYIAKTLTWSYFVTFSMP